MSEAIMQTGGLQRPAQNAAPSKALTAGAIAYHAAFGLLILIVTLSPLPLASNRPAFWGLLGVAAGIATVFWAASAILAPGRAQLVPFSEIRIPALLFGFAILWGIVQTLPFAPGGLAHPLWAEANALLNGDGGGTNAISINPYATGEAVFRLVTYGLVFWLALQFSVNERLARGLLWSFVASVVLYGLYGLGAHLSGSGSILWFEKWAYQNRLTGPFVNANSFATYLGMGLIAVTALLIRQITHSIDPSLPIRRRALQALDVAVGRGAFLATCVLLLTAALALTASRAGMAAALLGLLVMLQLRREGSRGRLRAWIGTVLVCAVLFVGVALSGEQLSNRFDDTAEHSDARWSVYVVTGRMIASAPILGTGYGTFQDAFTAYRDLTISATHTWDKAHNSYLETILGLGIPVGLALISAIGILVWRCAAGARKRRRNKIYSAVAAGVGVLIAAHAVVDFSIQMPAVAAVFAALLGLGIAQSKSPRERGQE